MSKNYDQIATVTIDLNSPLIDNTSFDNLLLFGPLPKIAPTKAPAKFGAYGSLDEVTEAGWLTTGDDPDPIGLAAQVAFSQSPPPSVLYIAPMQRTAKAIACEEAIKDVNEVFDELLGHGPGVESTEGCKVSYSKEKRILIMTLSGQIENVHKTGLFNSLKAIQEAGYTISLDGTTIADVTGFTSNPIYAKLQAMDAEGAEAVQFTIHVKGTAEEGHEKDAADVPYGVIVQWPKADDASEVEFTDSDLGDPAGELEDPTITLQRAMANAGWYVACPAGVDEKLYEGIAAYMETQEKMFVYTDLDFFNRLDDEGNPKTLAGSVYLRTAAIYGREDPDQPDEEIPVANRYLNVAFVAKWLNYESGSETTAFKTLQAVYPSELTTGQMKSLADANMNYFISVGNKNVTMNGKVLGDEWADVIRFRDWLKNDMQVRVCSLFIARPKIPYTDPGITLVQGAMIQSLNEGQRVGGIAPDEYDEDGTLIPGYVTSVPTAASLSPAERASRKLTRCKFTARLAGAIHFAELKGSLGYEII